MPSKKSTPAIVLDVANIGTASNLASDYPSIRKHLLSGRIQTVSGGSKFKKELKAAGGFTALFVELEKSNLIRKFSDIEADREVENFNSLQINEFGRIQYDCDDPHLFSLCRLSGARTIISKDKRIGHCRRKLRESGINNNEFTSPKLIRDERSYLKCFNSKTL